MAEDLRVLPEEGTVTSRASMAEACKLRKECLKLSDDEQYHFHLRHHIRFRTEPPSPPSLPQMEKKKKPTVRSTRSPNQQITRPKMVGSNWNCSGQRERDSGRGGGAMQAFFIDSGKRSSGGTGVFLPHTNSSTNKKPACAPVLLPSRVIQALKLNVHALGVQISPRQDGKDRTTLVESKTRKIRNVENETPYCVEVSPTRSSSPDIFLPKEWTY